MKKKIFGVIGLFVAALLITACGGSKGPRIVCTAEATDDSGNTQKSEMTAYLKDDKISDIDEIVTFADEETAKSYASTLQAFASLGGAELKIEQSGKEVTITNMAALLDGATDDEGNEIKVIGMTKDEFLNYTKQMGDEEGVTYNCSVKD